MLLPLYTRGKSPLYPLDRKLGGPQGRSARCGRQKNLELPGIEIVSYPDSILSEMNKIIGFGCKLSFDYNKSSVDSLRYLNLCVCPKIISSMSRKNISMH
jgi:hypothetical protein